MNQVDNVIEQAMQRQLTGDLLGAEQLYRRAIKMQPKNARAHRLLGAALYKLNRFPSASAALMRACLLDPNHGDGFVILGNSYLQQEKWPEAERALRRALELKPDFVPSMNNLAAVLNRQSKNEESEAVCRRALELDPDNAETLSNLSYVLHVTERYAESEERARRAVELNPDHAAACNNLAVALNGLQRFDEAELWCRKALSIQPDLWEAHIGLSNIMKAVRNMPVSVDAGRKAVELRPDKAVSHDVLGLALMDIDELEEAEACFRRAQQMDPKESVIYAHIASALRFQGRQEEALKYSAKAMDLKPEEQLGRFNVALDYLALGRLEEGWELYESRAALTGLAHRFHHVKWSGEPVSGKTLLVHVEQGFGDTIQFARYLPMVRSRFNGKIVFECQRALIPMLRDIPGFDEIIPRNSDMSPATLDYDYHVSVVSLAYIFGTRMDSIPDMPHLQAEHEKIESWRDRLSGYEGLKVGIRWAGNPVFIEDRRRSVHLSKLAPLAGVTGVSFFSLQTDAAARQLVETPNGMEIVDLSPELNDFQDTAAALMNLDLLISTDTSVPHLAGSLGRPTWMVLPFVPDWRWRMGPRDRSIWYPSIRMFRRKSPKEWDSVFREVAENLQALANGECGLYDGPVGVSAK